MFALLLKLLGDSAVIGFIQLFVGKWLKSKPWYANMYIPIATFLVAVMGFTIMPTAAHAAAFFNIPETLGVLAAALLQTQAITGTFSLGKNTLIPVAKQLLLWLVAKVAK